MACKTLPEQRVSSVSTRICSQLTATKCIFTNTKKKYIKSSYSSVKSMWQC